MINGNGQKTIIGIASTGLPDDTVIGGEIKNIPAFSEALKTLWKVGKFTAKDTRVIVNSESNVSKLETLDDELDFSRTLPFRLKAKNKLNPADYYISQHTLRKYEVQEEDRSALEGFRIVPKRDIFLAAAERVLVDSVLQSFAQTDFRILSIDIAPLALIRSESNLDPDSEEDQIDIHVNIGGDTTLVVISNNAQPVYVRIMNLGGNSITHSISEQLEISWNEAEQLKLNTLTMNPALLQRPISAGTVFGDFSDAPAPDGEVEYSVNQMDAYEITNDELAAIIENISKTILYFIDQNQYGLGQNINNLYLSGGTASFGKIRHHLYHEVNARNTATSTPLTKLLESKSINENLVAQFDHVQHEFSLAVGAILGQGGEKE